MVIKMLNHFIVKQMDVFIEKYKSFFNDCILHPEWPKLQRAFASLSGIWLDECVKTQAVF